MIGGSGCIQYANSLSSLDVIILKEIQGNERLGQANRSRFELNLETGAEKLSSKYFKRLGRATESNEKQIQVSIRIWDNQKIVSPVQ